MHYYEVIPLKIVHGSDGVLTYQSGITDLRHDSDCTCGDTDYRRCCNGPGSFNRHFATKSVIVQVESAPLPAGLVALSQWMSTFMRLTPSAFGRLCCHVASPKQDDRCLKMLPTPVVIEQVLCSATNNDELS